MLGFKYKYYMSTPAAGGEASDGTAPAVPDDLFKQTSLMIQHGILEMDSIYAMLGPDDKEIEEEAAKELSDATEFVRKMNVVSTGGEDKKADEKAEAEAAAEKRKKPANQKFGLLEALLRVGAWTEAESLMARMPAYYAVSQPKIAEALAELGRYSVLS